MKLNAALEEGRVRGAGSHARNAQARRPASTRTKVIIRRVYIVAAPLLWGVIQHRGFDDAAKFGKYMNLEVDVINIESDRSTGLRSGGVDNVQNERRRAPGVVHFVGPDRSSAVSPLSKRTAVQLLP